MKGIKLFKSLAATCLALTVLLGSSAAVAGAETSKIGSIGVPEITPYMLYTNSTSTGFDLSSSGVATGFASIHGYSSVTKIVIFLFLEKYSGGKWLTDGAATSTTYSSYAYLDFTDTVSHGYTYRVRGSYYVYSGTAYEHTTVYSGTEYY